MGPYCGSSEMLTLFGTVSPLTALNAVSMQTCELVGGNCNDATSILFSMASRRMPLVAAAPPIGGAGLTFASMSACISPVTASPPTPQAPVNVLPEAMAVAASCLPVLIEEFALRPVMMWLFGYFCMTELNGWS